MAKANGIVITNNIIGDKIQVVIAVSIVTPGNPALTARFDTAINITGSENPQQLNTALTNQIISDAIGYGFTGATALAASDITTTKFS